MKNQSYYLSLVVPVFNEEHVLPRFIERSLKVLNDLGCRYELLFVNDGSRDSTLSILKNAKKNCPFIKILSFSRNFGHQSAITAGIDHSQGDAVIIIDSDLQDPPELIPQLIAKWQEGYDIVDARRERRLGETFFKKWTAAIFYRIINKLSNVELPTNVGDYRLLSRRAVDALGKLRENHRYVRGLIAWTGYPRASVDYVRDSRYSGSTKYGLWKMIRFSLDGITAFSILPLRIASFLGILVAFLALLYIPYALYVKFVLQTAIAGWTSVVTALFFLGGIQLFCIGILGEYIGIIHDETKKRPLYLVGEFDA